MVVRTWGTREHLSVGDKLEIVSMEKLLDDNQPDGIWPVYIVRVVMEKVDTEMSLHGIIGV